MSDITTALERLGDDVTPTRLRSAEQIRQTAAHHHRRQVLWVTAPVAATVIVAAAFLPNWQNGDRASVAVTSPDPTSADALPDRAWLPAPWRVTRSQSTSLAGAARDGDDFCGLTQLSGDRAAVRQDLSDGTRTVRVYGVAPGSLGGAADLFKAVYAQCGQRGPVASEPGPALFWQTDDRPAAALWDDSVVYLLVSPRGDASTTPADLRTVMPALIAAVGSCDTTATATCSTSNGTQDTSSASP